MSETYGQRKDGRGLLLNELTGQAGCGAKYMTENWQIEQLQRDNAELQQEVVELRAHVERLASALNRYSDESHIMSLLNDIPKQSLHAHDLEIAERVLLSAARICYETHHVTLGDKILNLDLSKAIKDA